MTDCGRGDRIEVNVFPSPGIVRSNALTHFPQLARLTQLKSKSS
jgi:hypothetical protein